MFPPARAAAAAAPTSSAPDTSDVVKEESKDAAAVAADATVKEEALDCAAGEAEGAGGGGANADVEATKGSEIKSESGNGSGSGGGVPATPPHTHDHPLELCMRFLPHHQDTGGFFVAVLEKMGECADLVVPQNAKRAAKDAQQKNNGKADDGNGNGTTNVNAKRVCGYCLVGTVSWA